MELEREFVGRTFDDFLIRPQESVVASRKQVPLDLPLTADLSLNLPIVSANMDSVTGADMAKSMALEGGIGIIHRGLSIDAQAGEVRSVKRAHGYIIEEPFCLERRATLRQARQFTRQHEITGILIEENPGSRILAGLLSNRDMPWMGEEGERRVEEFMTPVEELVTARPGIDLAEAERLMFEHRIEKLPLVDEERRIQGLITKKDTILFRHQPFSSKDAKGRLLVGAAIGARGDFLERAEALIEAGADVLVIDIAHGHSRVMREAVGAFRKKLSNTPLIGGNVGTAAGALFLKELGVDAVKVGIGPGRGCRTRLETGSGIPQLQAIREAWCALEDSIPILADGGIRHDKDIFLALACGASSVMLGSLLSGTDEAPGTVIIDPATGEKSKIYRGMTSPEAVLGGLYEAENEDDLQGALETPPEGQQMQVPYRGAVSTILNRIRGHLASAVSYAGGADLAAARQRIVRDPFEYLIPISESARRESYER